ncbi:hypothetical protein scyTo_0019725 [Scyliorhinus torazame]|uniref:RNase H type-1 domain-containing protein n=1 Tax=Scyliorhinus torazame TaxID=75743 RepID=A0A401PPQ6_SCYTO|nr:hypothetical protein [Scyliorhinus torazame]
MENPAIGLTIQGMEHECVVEVEEDTSGGLAEEPLVGEGVNNLYVDGARKYIGGEPRTAWAVVDSEGELIAGEQIPGNHSAQIVGLITLTKALEWGKGKQINVYTDSRDASGIVHDYMTAWSRRGFVTSSGGHIQHESLIRDLILAARQPLEAAVIKDSIASTPQDSISSLVAAINQMAATISPGTRNEPDIAEAKSSDPMYTNVTRVLLML